MATLPAFNAAEWIAENTLGGTRLTSETQETVAGFTTMWNFFESTLCGNRASIAAFERVLESFRPEDMTQTTSQKLAECLVFWRMRYGTPGGFSENFHGLNFRAGDRKPHVEAVLSSEGGQPEDQLLALMIIVYRLRNNLFHGLKSLEMLNDQVHNLTNASLCLAAILESMPSRWVTPQRRRAEGA